MEKSNKKRIKNAHLKAPGSLVFLGNKKVERIRISGVLYNKDEQVKLDKIKIKEIKALNNPNKVFWIQVHGIHEVEIIKDLGDLFGLHPLLIEDILNTRHRQKFEMFDHLASALIKAPTRNDEKAERVDIGSFEQLSFVAGKNFVISFAESNENIFNGVEHRILNPRTRIIERGADYLLFALIDTVVDLYHNKLEDLGDEIDVFLDGLIENNYQMDGVEMISTFKKELNIYRRNIRPIIEISGQFERSEAAVQDESVLPFISDLKDHGAHILEHVETMTERLNEEFAIMNSYSANRLNDIMRILTIYSVIFIPITFIAGVYGMNFQNIPELVKPNAYYIFWIVVILIVSSMIAYFYKKKWL